MEQFAQGRGEEIMRLDADGVQIKRWSFGGNLWNRRGTPLLASTDQINPRLDGHVRLYKSSLNQFLCHLYHATKFPSPST